jgi:hypothetical protein
LFKLAMLEVSESTRAYNWKQLSRVKNSWPM